MDSRATILAVDDEPSSLLLLTTVLQMDDAYTVLTATNTADAMLVAERHLPDLVITDRHMPGRDGFDLCRWIKSHHALSASMVMMLTASSDTESIVRGLDLGADDYLTKPFHPDELHSRVRALLRIKRLSDQRALDNARLEELVRELHENLAGVMHLITHMIELRVPDSLVRAERAGGMARWVGERLKLEAEQLEGTVLAARIHEIGKIVMADDLLVREGRGLSGDQHEALAQFPLFGQMLVGRIPQFRQVATTLRHQLENFDGTGHPDHLLGAQIPLAARILRAVNVVEEAPGGALPAEVIERLQKARGTSLDPVVTQLAVEYVTTMSDPSWIKGKRQVGVGAMQEGTVLAADLSTANGIKLLPKDTRLTGSHITWIQSHHRVDPILFGIYVYEQP
jgi:response regulator RpfG family c-di-GMP phosphodiesterase